MIIYGKHWGAVNLLFRFYGASWPRAIILSILPTVAAVVMFIADQKLYPTPSSPPPGMAMPSPPLLLGSSPPVVMAMPPPSFPPQGGLFTHTSFFRRFQLYTAFATLVTFFLTFRTQLSYARYNEAVTSVKTLTTRLADAAMQLVGCEDLSMEETSKEGVAAVRFRSQLLHLMSLVHALALQRLRGDSDLNNLTLRKYDDSPERPKADPGKDEFWMSLRGKHIIGSFFLRTDKGHFRDYWKARPLPVLGGVSADEVNRLQKTDNRVWLALSWLNRLVTRHIKNPAPHMKEANKVLGDGFMAYNNALKLVFTPYPFPLAQSATILLYMLCTLTPFAAVRHAGQASMAGVITFVIVFAAQLLNEVALEVEDPFKYDPNDLPSPLYQHDLNAYLLTLALQEPFPHELGVFFGQKASMMRAVAMKGSLGGSAIQIDSPDSPPPSMGLGLPPPPPLTQPLGAPRKQVGSLQRNLDSDDSPTCSPR